MKNGSTVATFEREFAAYVGGKYAIACANGTVTLQGALHALGVKSGDRVAVPPLTMAATTIAVLNVGAVPVFVDVTPDEWVMSSKIPHGINYHLPVDLYGLVGRATGMFIFGCGASGPKEQHTCVGAGFDDCTVYDSAQTLAKHTTGAFTSYSFQASKILSTGEGGMLVTDDEALAAAARSYLSLGYRLRPDQPRINPDTLKSPTYQRHYLAHSINGRMNDLTAEEGLRQLDMADALLGERAEAAGYYRHSHAGCPWLTPQYVPDGWRHDYWTYAVATDTPQRAMRLAGAIVTHGGERPYPAWRLTYTEPAFRPLAPNGTCPIAEDLQPRILQFQTNSLDSAARNADALRDAILDCENPDV
jgi:perosamine synthetase